MDRSPSPPAPQPSVYADTESFMETVRRFTGQTAPTSAAAAAQRGATVRMLPLEPVQQHQSILATATAPGPSASGPQLQLTLSPPSSWLDNPGPCVLNMAPDPRSLATSSSSSTVDEEVAMEDAEEVEMGNPEEVEAVGEGRFYLLPPPPPPERNAGDGEPKLLILFPLSPSSGEGN